MLGREVEGRGVGREVLGRGGAGGGIDGFDATAGAVDDERRRVVVDLRDGFLAPLDEKEGLRFLEEEEAVVEGLEGGGIGGAGGRGAVVVFLRGEEAEGR